MHTNVCVFMSSPFEKSPKSRDWYKNLFYIPHSCEWIKMIITCKTGVKSVLMEVKMYQ